MTSSAQRFHVDGESPTQRASRAALLLIDVINPMDFDGAEKLRLPAEEAAERLRRLKKRCGEHGIPAIYVNDNFDRWHLGFRQLVEQLREADVPGRRVIDLLEPEPDWDFYILKPSQSGFFRTGLEVLLERLGVRTLILTGFAGDICVLFTANDAYMRGFDIVVPADCIASGSAAANEHALGQMERLLKADVRPSAELELDGLREHAGRRERSA